ncbi:gas vesicle protein K, partial [Streptomyces prasinus]|uniref:gas vesicle protein K n=1 Tax=Streptomyces prasinus TaxID=67345 RepID=UPI00362A9F7A
MEPDTVERDLVKLVLTVVELLRQLMERQALRRFDEGDLTEDQEERIGLTLMLLEERMAELRDRYGLGARARRDGPRPRRARAARGA